ncbi:hypothetical protein KK083_04240 [Fulvivirgaceae bacterium PWU4]|uniref:Uncharacterized protein n=1 Tax=Chryseosolibacter histidini TaxID=2782349 RepID=A0AAP2DIM5_9BACT|nr:hypothetical protein [Chryseosolibacter histidini]MBT1696073.1 hypothetical protein [Chryseosolibacter histidini]
MHPRTLTPEEYTGAAIADLDMRRGIVRENAMEGNAQWIDADVPPGGAFRLWDHVADVANRTGICFADVLLVPAGAGGDCREVDGEGVM